MALLKCSVHFHLMSHSSISSYFGPDIWISVALYSLSLCHSACVFSGFPFSFISVCLVSNGGFTSKPVDRLTYKKKSVFHLLHSGTRAYPMYLNIRLLCSSLTWFLRTKDTYFPNRNCFSKYISSSQVLRPKQLLLKEKRKEDGEKIKEFLSSKTPFHHDDLPLWVSNLSEVSQGSSTRGVSDGGGRSRDILCLFPTHACSSVFLSFKSFFFSRIPVKNMFAQSQFSLFISIA